MGWTPDRLRRAEAVFLEIAELSELERRDALGAACLGDAELENMVQRLIDADADVDDLIDRGLDQRLRGHDPLLGQRFGAFRLEERIAEGGMGTVYRAERWDGDFRQQAAVKVLRFSLSSPAMRAHFARERQTLARLEHANVARIYDGGTSEHGVPFIAMEYVDGLRIDHYCDLHGLGVEGRLRLFIAVCRVVQHAHQRLVLHLDLKPSNILIDEHGAPKLVDFGVARLLGADDVSAADAADSATRSRPCTPEYASPEQLRGEPLSTAADVHSLGAVLFDLLTGLRARRAAGAAADRFDLALHAAPARPSDAFGRSGAEADTAEARAARRGCSAAAMRRRLRGDLDHIVAVAMAHDVDVRYASCADLADDLQRHLDELPVRVRDGERGYRLRRFLGRNRLAIAAATAVSVALLGGIVATARMADVAEQERDRVVESQLAVERERDVASAARREAELQRDTAAAAQERAELEAEHARIEATSSNLVAAMLGDMLLSGKRVNDPGERALMLATIERKAEQVRRQFAAGAHVRANVLDQLGRACTGIGAFDHAEKLLAEAADVRRREFGAESLENALSLGGLGQMYFASGRLALAVEALREAHRLHRDCDHGVHSDVAGAANDLAAAESALGNRERARALHEQALALRREAGDEVRTAESLNNLANAVADPREARSLLGEALALREQHLGPQDPLTLQTRVNLAVVAMRSGEFEAAVESLTAAIDGFRRLEGLGDEGLTRSLRLLAQARLAVGDAAAARPAIDEAVEVDRRRASVDRAALARTLEVQATVFERLGDWATAVGVWREVVRLREEVLPAAHVQLELTRCSLGTAMVRAGDVDGGLALLRAVHGLLRQQGTAEETGAIDAQIHLALAEEVAGGLAEAERLLLEAERICREVPLPARLGLVRSRVQAFYQRQGRAADAARFGESADPGPARR